MDDHEARRRRFDLRGRTLREHAARGTVINAGFTVGTSLLGLVKGFVLAAFLTRADYGVWGILVVSLGALFWLKQIGIGDRYVQQDEEDQETAFQEAFTVETVVTGTFVVLLGALLPLIGWIYGEPKLVAPGLLVLLMLPAGVLQMPLYVHYRRMEFLRQRLLMSVDPIVGFAASIALAVAGAGYWALIGGVLAGAWAAALAAVITSPFKLRLRWRKGLLRSYASFSGPLFVSAVATMVIAQAAVLMTEAELGLAGAGAIALAATITQFTDRVDGLITATVYPAICAVRDRVDLLAESFVKTNRIGLMWAFPFGLGLTLFSADLVEYVIGEQWEPAVIVLQIYGVTAALGTVAFNWDSYFKALGRTRPIAVASVVAAVVFLATALPLLLAYGLAGFAVGVAAQALAHLLCRAYFLSRLFDGFSYFAHAQRAILPTLPAVAVVLALRSLPIERSLAVAAGELVVFMAVAALMTWLLEGRLLREAIGYLRPRPSATSA